MPYKFVLIYSEPNLPYKKYQLFFVHYNDSNNFDIMSSQRIKIKKIFFIDFRVKINYFHCLNKKDLNFKKNSNLCWISLFRSFKHYE